MNNAAVASITRRNSSGSRCRRQLNAPSASPVSAGTPIIMNVLNVYRSIPATRWRIEPYSGTETRYPPPNMWSGPQSPATRPGSSFMIRFERHVYQAGSRVGALIEGSWMNVQPNATRTISVARRGTAGEARTIVRPFSVVRTTCPVRSFVSADAFDDGDGVAVVERVPEPGLQLGHVDGERAGHLGVRLRPVVRGKHHGPLAAAHRSIE